MKSLKILSLIFSTLIMSACFAEQDNSLSLVTPIKDVKIEGINFESLPTESHVGNLLEFVQDGKFSFNSLLESTRSRPILHPFAEGLAYVNGVLCHVGHYSQSILYTVLDGPQYGLQTTVANDGLVLYVNYDYKIKYTPAGVILRHTYSDCKVITGSNQVIIFY